MTLFQRQRDLADVWLGESARTSCKSIETDGDGDDEQVDVCFRNHCDIPLVLCWVDADGAPDNFYRIDPCGGIEGGDRDISDDDHVENSFVGHAFIIARGDDIEAILQSESLDAASSIIVGGYRSKKGGLHLVEIHPRVREETADVGISIDFQLIVKCKMDPTTLDLADIWLGDSATRTSCKSIESDGDEEDMRVWFRNLCNIPLVLCWVNVDGTPASFYRLDPSDATVAGNNCLMQDDHVEYSFVGHAFIFARGRDSDIEEILRTESLDTASTVGGYRSKKGGLHLVEILPSGEELLDTSSDFLLAVKCILDPTPALDLLADIWLGESARTSCMSIDAGDEELQVCFRNLTNIPLVLCWVDQDGTPDNFSRLNPYGGNEGDMISDDDHVENSYVGHAFIIARGQNVEEIIQRRSLDTADIAGGYRSKEGGLHLVEITTLGGETSAAELRDTSISEFHLVVKAGSTSCGSDSVES